MTKHPGFPVLIAYPRPTQMIKRDENDHWNPTLDQINNGKYDYVKLHRLSTSFDIGLKSPFCMHLSFNGALLLPAIPDLHSVEKSSELFNKFLGKLILGGVFYDAISPSEIDRGILYPTGYFRGFGLPHGSFAQIQASVQQKLASPIHSIDLLDPIFTTSRDVHEAFNIGNKVSAIISNLSPELFLKGVSGYVGRAWSEALSNLWICTEQIISHMWEEELVAKAGSIQPDIPGRKDFLKDNRTWTTSTKVEMLYIKGLIDVETYVMISRARKARNDLVHKGTSPKIEDVEANIDATFRLISSLVYDSINNMDSIVNKYKQMDPIKKRETASIKGPIPLKEIDGIWLGPLPPIPGENEWGRKKYEEVFQNKVNVPPKGSALESGII